MMRAFLRDLAFLALFAAAVAAVVLVVLMHQGRITVPGMGEAAPAVANAELPAGEVRAPRTGPAAHAPAPAAGRPAVSAQTPRSTSVSGPPGAAASFDPTTRGVAGDARVLCLPEIAWLQNQLDRWAGAARLAPHQRPTTLAAAHAAARRASEFSYDVSLECWNDPDVVESRGWGDCADKSLWLARELLRAGYPMVGIRLGVAEGYTPGQPGHAWVVLYHHGGEWIYDPAAGPRLASQDAGPTKRFRITATVFPRTAAGAVQTSF